MGFGVGVIGAGPGAAALHLPTLARLAGTFEVVHIADGGSGRARDLAEPLGARWSTGTQDLLADRRVEVVVICSPPQLHAEHIRAAVEAGVRGILCEKPLATDPEAARTVVELCREEGTALIIGTNHLFDPAWTRAKHHLLAQESPVTSISVTMSLAPNSKYHALVTDLETAPAARPRPTALSDDIRADIVRQLVSGLLVHDLPLVRDLAPRLGPVHTARFLPPLGCLISYDGGGVAVQLAAVMSPEVVETRWRMTIMTSHDRLDVEFPPPFVHAGSAHVSVRSADGRTTRYPRSPDNGYTAEWQALARMLEGAAPVEYDEPLADALYSLSLADAAALLVERGVA